MLANLLERLFAERIDQNEEIFVRFMNDASFRETVSRWVASEAYGRLQAEPEAADGSTLAQAHLAGLRLVPSPSLEERYTTCVPLVPLKAAAGAFGEPQHIAEENDFEWVAVESRRRLAPGMFVAQVVGKSMEPVVPDGAWCLFRAPVEGTRQGKTVLVQMLDSIDPETGQRYTVKRYKSQKAQSGDSWQHTRITLRPANPAYEPIVLIDTGEATLQVIAEVLEVLPSNDLPGRL